jgi:hypothetical protein
MSSILRTSKARPRNPPPQTALILQDAQAVLETTKKKAKERKKKRMKKMKNESEETVNVVVVGAML